MREYVQVMRGGTLIESERYIDFTVIADPAPDSLLMQVSRQHIRFKPNGRNIAHREKLVAACFIEVWLQTAIIIVFGKV